MLLAVHRTLFYIPEGGPTSNGLPELSKWAFHRTIESREYIPQVASAALCSPVLC